MLYHISLRVRDEAAINSSFLNGIAIKALPSPPLELNCRWNVETLEKKVQKKIIFSLMARPCTPQPFLNGTVIKRRTFFCGFPK